MVVYPFIVGPSHAVALDITLCLYRNTWTLAPSCTSQGRGADVKVNDPFIMSSSAARLVVAATAAR